MSGSSSSWTLSASFVESCQRPVLAWQAARSERLSERAVPSSSNRAARSTQMAPAGSRCVQSSSLQM
eukprot:3849712-Alexandrium_andersonii.AAC.1